MSDYPVPLVLTCTVTGRQVKYYSRPYIEKRIAKAGDLQTLVNTFMTKGAKKKTPAPKPSTPKIEAVVVMPEENNRDERIIQLTVNRNDEPVSCLVCVEK